MNNQAIFREVVAAYQEIRSQVRKTPLEYSPFLSKETGAEVYLKLENYQLTGSFKIRGAFNAANHFKKTGVREYITASTGNHGSASAYAAKELGLSCKVYMPENATRAKVEYLQFLGAETILTGTDCLEAEVLAREESSRSGIPYLSPYNDPFVLAGQGTVALEILQELPDAGTLIVPVGGGGLMAGIAGYSKEKLESVEIIGAQPANSCVMYHSVNAGEILDIASEETLADGVAGGIEAGSVTFLPCKNNVDRFILLDEKTIAQAMIMMMDRHFMLVEGSGALAPAALMQQGDIVTGRKVVLIISGGKISRDKLAKILTS